MMDRTPLLLSWADESDALAAYYDACARSRRLNAQILEYATQPDLEISAAEFYEGAARESRERAMRWRRWARSARAA